MTGKTLNNPPLKKMHPVPTATIYQWRHHRVGPPAFKVGRHLRYDPDAVRSWLTCQAA